MIRPSALVPRFRPASALAVLVLAATTLPAAEQTGQFRKATNFVVRAGDARTGDLYAFAQNIDIAGVQDGDLIGFAQTIVVSGEVTGDLASWSGQMTVSGTVRDSMRSGAQSLVVSGVIEGDLLAFAQTVNVTSTARITGNLRVFGGEIVMMGTVDGEMSATGGQARIGGTIGGNASLEFDQIEIEPDARFRGDLEYTARNRLDLEGSPVVAGAVSFKPQQKKADSGPKPGATASAILGWVWSVAVCILVGGLLVALFRRTVVGASRTVGEETLLGTLIGFGSAIVAPVAAVLLVAVLVLVPLMIIGIVTTGGPGGWAFVTTGALSGFFLGAILLVMYLAKIPVALWVGRRVLALVGRTQDAPFLGMAIGVVVLYLLFAIPFAVGFLSWLAVSWLGLGATILAVRRRINDAGGGGAPAPAIETPATEPAP